MIFAPTNPEKLVNLQLTEARLGLLEHQKAAEYHQAIAAMFEARIQRLATHQKGTP